MNELTISYEDFIVKFRKTITSLGLKNSNQREYVLKILFQSNSHLSVDEIGQEVLSKCSHKISTATVYKILKLLEELKIVNCITIGKNDKKVYELNLKSHHDHMVCQECGNFIEFYNEDIEKLQKEIAKKNNFLINSHTMIIYGICDKCQ
ncbi:MAG: transcriptional repressor [Campylobacterales bacterium]|nr:transcriptional repressor [Campylobacterales bacterium]